MEPGEMQRRLDAISGYDGEPYGRVHLLFDAEKAYGLQATKLRGYLSLSDAFKCFFLETVETFNSYIRPQIKTPLSEFHGMFFPRLVYAWQSLCGFERLALNGYPFQAYAGVRNIFDSVQTVSAALQGFVDFYAAEGVVPEQPFDLRQIKKLRRQTEQQVSILMSGVKSGLTQSTIDELAAWDEMFNFEVHGGRLSFAAAVGFMRGQAPLQVLPFFQTRDFAVFMNRYCEVGWMTHRLIPLVQPVAIPFDQAWKKKWKIIDESFDVVVQSLTKENAKAIGSAIAEYVTVKFPFDADSEFPLK
jgi:hypothetical protein